MRQLIEIKQENIVECDNPQCDYKVPNKSKSPTEGLADYLNKPCPKCGENLLTDEDLRVYIRYLAAVNWINKWFSWITIFIKPKDPIGVTVKVHDGIKMNVDEPKTK